MSDAKQSSPSSAPAGPTPNAPTAGAVRHKGECKWFSVTKGFGFITPSDGTEDIFVHQSAIHSDGFRSLAEKEPVEFEIAKDENGRPKAINVSGPNGTQVKGAPKPRARFIDGVRRGGRGGGRGGRGRGRGTGRPQGATNTEEAAPKEATQQ